MRTRIGMRGVKNVTATRLQGLHRHLHMQGHVIRMQVLEKLVAESHIDRSRLDLQMVAVVDDQFEIVWRGVRDGALVGNIHAQHMLHLAANLVGQAAVPRRKFKEGRIGTNVISKNRHSRLHPPPALLRRLPPHQARVVGHALEQLVVEL